MLPTDTVTWMLAAAGGVALLAILWPILRFQPWTPRRISVTAAAALLIVVTLAGASARAGGAVAWSLAAIASVAVFTVLGAGEALRLWWQARN